MDDVRSAQRRDVVLATAAGLSAAQRFCHLTGRELLVRRDAAEVVAVLDDRDVGSALLSLGEVPLSTVAQVAATAQRSRVAVGWLFGWMGTDVAVQHAEKIAAPTFSGGDALIWSAVPIGTVKDVTHDRTRLIRGPHRDLGELSRAPHAFLGLTGHGLGIDMWLGPDLLCTVADPAFVPLPLDQAAHPCMHGGPCFRGASDAPHGPRRAAASSLRADVVVLDSCRSMLLSGSRAVPSLAASVSTGDHGAVVIATIGEAWGSPAAQVLAWQDWRRGASAGDLLRLHNDANMESMGTAPFILIGDPITSAGAAVAPTEATDDTTNAVIDVIEVERTQVPVLDGAPRPGARPQVWATRVPGSDRAIAVVEDLDVESFRAEDASRDPVSRLRDHLLDSTPAVATARSFVSHVLETLDGDAREHARHLLEDLETRLLSTSRLRAGFPSSVVDGGEHGARLRWFRHERDAWRGLQSRLADVCHDHAVGTGNLDAALGDVVWSGSLRAGPTGSSCPCCGGPREHREHPLPEIGRSRLRLVCWGCDARSDGPAETHPLEIEGPSELRPGTDATYVVTGGPAGDLDAVRFGIVRVPWGLDVTAREPADDDAGRRWTLSVSSGAPGSYSMVVVAVASGEVLLAKRPVVVLPPDTSAHPHGWRSS